MTPHTAFVYCVSLACALLTAGAVSHAADPAQVASKRALLIGVTGTRPCRR